MGKVNLVTGEMFMGLGASKGEATGTARLWNAPKFKEGDILVASMTTPDAVPNMRLASAIATDTGSITCHASIVARELGKPCVVNTKSATTLVGREITVIVNGIKDAYIRTYGFTDFQPDPFMIEVD